LSIPLIHTEHLHENGTKENAMSNLASKGTSSPPPPPPNSSTNFLAD